MDELYRLAFEFKKTKLWTRMFEDQLFAVQLSDGETGYCSVMGRNGEHLALALYPGKAGHASYARIAMGPSVFDPVDNLHRMEYLLSQDCVMCSYENKEQLRKSELSEVRDYCARNGISLRGAHAWPQLQRHQPRRMPWMIREESDRQRLREALLAGLEVASQLEKSKPKDLGLAGGQPYDREIPLLVRCGDTYEWKKTRLPSIEAVSYPRADVLDGDLLNRAIAQKKRAGTWSCDVFVYPEPTSEEARPGQVIEEPYSAPFFPWTQVICNESAGDVIDSSISKEADDYSRSFPEILLDLICTLGKPRKLLVETERTYTLYAGLAQKLGIKIDVSDTCEVLDDALDQMDDFLSSDENRDTPEEEMLDQITDFLFSYEDLSEVPDDIIIMFSHLARMMPDSIPAEQVQRVNEEFRRRFK